MSRFGLDIALDTIGIIHGLASACNISTYIDSTGAKVEVPFVDDGGVFVPATGDIGAPIIGYRDPLTGDFINIKSSIYWDGSTPATETSVLYTVDADDNYHPVTDSVSMDSTVTLEMKNADVIDYAIEFIEGVRIKPTTDTDLDGVFVASHTSLLGSISWTIGTTGLVQLSVRDNLNTFIVFATSSIGIKDGFYHDVHIETIANGANYDFRIYIDGVDRGGQNNVVVTGGLLFNKFVWQGTGSAPFEGKIKYIYSIRKGPGGFQRTALLGFYNTVRRLRKTVIESKRFYNQLADIMFPSSTRYIELSKTSAVYPNVTDGYIQKEEVFE